MNFVHKLLRVFDILYLHLTTPTSRYYNRISETTFWNSLYFIETDFIGRKPTFYNKPFIGEYNPFEPGVYSINKKRNTNNRKRGNNPNKNKCKTRTTQNACLIYYLFVFHEVHINKLKIIKSWCLSYIILYETTKEQSD